jgi:hypothetical protein
MENNTIHFTKDDSGNILAISEFNTKITYANTKVFTIGRLEFTYTRYYVLATLRARIKFSLYTGLKSALRGLGVHVDLAS